MKAYSIISKFLTITFMILSCSEFVNLSKSPIKESNTDLLANKKNAKESKIANNEPNIPLIKKQILAIIANPNVIHSSTLSSKEMLNLM